MIIGTITNRRAHVQLPIRGMGGSGNVEFTIDTGFTAYMTLPPTACLALKLLLIFTDKSYLADGSFIWTNTYRIIVSWDGEEREIDVIGVESEPLIGMTMLDGCRVEMDVKENGVVRIEKSAE